MSSNLTPSLAPSHELFKAKIGILGTYMNDFYITVNNGLLKHKKRMGSAVWEFMWLLDKITSVSEDGVGLVLGGRPIKLEEIANDLEITRVNVSIALNKLEKEGYIQTLRTAYGTIIKIYKAKKVFNQKRELSKTITPELSKSINPVNKTIILRKQIDNSNIRQDTRQDKIDILEFWNRTYGTKFKSIDPLKENMDYWLQVYSLEEIKTAIENVKLDTFWKDKMTPTTLFRQKNQNKERVDYIGQLLNIRKEQAHTPGFELSESLGYRRAGG